MYCFLKYNFMHVIVCILINKKTLECIQQIFGQKVCGQKVFSKNR